MAENSFTLQCGPWLTSTCYRIRQSVRHIAIYTASDFDFDHHRSRHVILHQSAKFYLNRTALSVKN